MKKFSIWMEERLHELAAPGQQPATGTAPAATKTAAATTIDPKSPAYKSLLGRNLNSAVNKNTVKGSLGEILNTVVTKTSLGQTV
jgi:hypothetical protein